MKKGCIFFCKSGSLFQTTVQWMQFESVTHEHPFLFQAAESVLADLSSLPVIPLLQVISLFVLFFSPLVLNGFPYFDEDEVLAAGLVFTFRHYWQDLWGKSTHISSSCLWRSPADGEWRVQLVKGRLQCHQLGDSTKFECLRSYFSIKFRKGCCVFAHMWIRGTKWIHVKIRKVFFVRKVVLCLWIVRKHSTTLRTEKTLRIFTWIHFTPQKLRLLYYSSGIWTQDQLFVRRPVLYPQGWPEAGSLGVCSLTN